jgi:uncharacterized SAM-binding protein YcdF (DUF218 family)
MLLEFGVPEASIVRELCSLSTVENAVYSAELLRALGFVRPGLVTCDWHMRRAIACFERAGTSPVALPAPSLLNRRARLAQQAMEQARGWLDRRLAGHWVP